MGAHFGERQLDGLRQHPLVADGRVVEQFVAPDEGLGGSHDTREVGLVEPVGQSGAADSVAVRDAGVVVPGVTLR